MSISKPEDPEAQKESLDKKESQQKLPEVIEEVVESNSREDEAQRNGGHVLQSSSDAERGHKKADSHHSLNTDDNLINSKPSQDEGGIMKDHNKDTERDK